MKCFYKPVLIVAALFISSLFLSSCKKETEEPSTTTGVGWAVGTVSDDAGTILHTLTNGLYWDRQFTFLAEGRDLYDVSAISNDEAWIVGEKKDGYGIILHTTDGGASWMRSGNRVEVPNVNLNAVYAVSSTKIFAAGDSSTILMSVDAGGTWMRLFPDTIPVTSFKSITVQDDIIWVAGTRSDPGYDAGVLVVSTNGGLTWRRQAEFQLTFGINDIQSVGPTSLVLCGYENTAVSNDAGETWSVVMNMNNTDLRGICATANDNIWVVAGSEKIYHYNHGSMDTICSSYSHNYFNGVTAMNETHIWACGKYGYDNTESLMYFSNNEGQTWFFGQSTTKALINRVSFVGDVR